MVRAHRSRLTRLKAHRDRDCNPGGTETSRQCYVGCVRIGRSYGWCAQSCMSVRNSLSDLKEQARRVHRVPKPGGELIFWERRRNTSIMTKTPGKPPNTRTKSQCMNGPFRQVMSRCRLGPVTRDVLIKAADWEVVDAHANTEAHMMMLRLWMWSRSCSASRKGVLLEGQRSTGAVETRRRIWPRAPSS